MKRRKMANQSKSRLSDLGNIFIFVRKSREYFLTTALVLWLFHRQLLRKEEEELSKINSSMGAVILKDLKEHAKNRKWKQHNIDPRNASRTPSASKEPVYRLRYESPIGASPSRHLDHQKPFYEDEVFERSTSYRGSVGRSIGNAPSYNGKGRISMKLWFFVKIFSFYVSFVDFFFVFFSFYFFERMNKTAIHSYRSPPKPGYGFKTSTLPSSIGYRNGYSSVSYLSPKCQIKKKKNQKFQLELEL